MGGLHKSPKLNCRRWGSPLWRLMSCHVTTRLFTFTGAVWKLLQLREPGWDIKDFCQVKSSLSPDADIKHEQSKFFFHLQLVFLSLGVGGSGKGDKGLFSVNVAVADLKARTLKTVLNGLDFLQMLINTDKCICSINCRAFSTTACEVSVCEERFLSDTQRKTTTSYFTKKNRCNSSFLFAILSSRN